MKTKKLISAFLAFSMVFATVPCFINNRQIIQTNADMSYSDFARQVAVIVNQERTAQGLAPVEMSAVMNRAASVRADELIELCSHTRPDGSSCFTVFDEYNIKYMHIGAENLHAGSSTPEDAMKAWMSSDGHRANILAEKAKYIGVGVACVSGRYYWIQLFTDIRPDGECYAPESPEADLIRGDVNNDGIINASDSSSILAEYAALSSGESGSFDEKQKTAADFNNDGIMNASDSSEVLKYYADKSSGN